MFWLFTISSWLIIVGKCISKQFSARPSKRSYQQFSDMEEAKKKKKAT